MSDQRPDPAGSTTPPDEPIDPTEIDPSIPDEPAESSAEADVAEEAAEPTESDADTLDDGVEGDEVPEPEAVASEEVATEGLGPEVADAVDQAYEPPAWATTPVQPDPAATAAALAALSAAPDVYDQGLPPGDVAPEELPYDDAAYQKPPSDGEPPGWEEPAEDRSSTLLVGGILIGALIVALGIIFLLFRPFDSGTPVASPSLSPSPIVSPSPSPSVEPTEEVGGTVGTPDFQGLSLTDAQTEADDAGLILQIEDVETDDFDPDTVVDQDPAPGIVLEVGSTVRLSVAVPVETAAVPDLVGLAADEAEAALEEAGLSGEASEAFDASVAAGTVVSQDPAPDTELAAGSAVAYVVSAGPAPVAVPDLVGLAADEAEAALEEAGLSGEASEAFDASVAAGTVVSQDPAPDTELAAGSAVAYVVSAGPAPVAVPDLVGLAADEAEAALEEAGLSGEASEAFDASVAAGTVVSQDPAPDTELAAGSAVAYVVSAGPAPVAVPDLVGLAADEAEAALEEAGLSGEASEAFDASVAAGTVVSQDPAPDTELAAGSAVAYVVSAGPAPVAVPDLVGLAADEAEAALEEAGLSGEASEAFDASVAAGTVVSQDPAPDTELAAGSAVAYVVSAGPAPVAVPDLVGLAADEAEAALEEAGLSGEASEAFDASVAAGTVVSQDPAPDTELAAGSAVAYVVSAGPAPVAVPDLVGLAADEAEAALEEAGLSGEASEAFDASVAAGTVVSQDPAPDTELAAGSAVAYVVSAGPAPVAVPDLVGLAADEAEAALEEAGLSGEASEAFDASVAAGTVVSQDPAPDTELAAGSAVAYVVSAGPAPVAVPDLVGLAADEAEAALEEAGLSGEASEAFDASVAAGTVVSQDPAPDTELAAGSAVAYVVSAGPAPVAVPDLVGLAADEAEAALEEAGLSGEASEAFDASVAAGTVVSQDPAPDTELAAGSAVAYVVSAGPAPVAVPDLVGLAADEAEAALEEAGLSGEASEAFDASVAAGTVVSQDPAPDTELAAGSAVAYVVSAGPAPVAVPDLVGLAADEAEAALEEAGLSGEASEAFDASVAAGTVVSQDPAPDTELAAGSAVAYVVSAGPAPVAVPDLVGLAADEAEAALEEAGLSGEASEAFDASVAAGTVVSQDPAPDTELAAGSAVAYVVSAGPAPVAVPDLVGLAADEAEAALEEAGLSGEASEAFDASVAAGTVVSQDPAPDTELAAGSAVAYVVSAGPAPVAVPDLVGLAADEAEAALEEAGLSGEASEAFDASVAAGTVVSQDPAPDTELAAGSAVAYVVSAGPAPVAVPDLVGLAADEAEAALEEAGLSGEASEAFDASVAAGTVVSQDPAPDTELAAGSAVAYVVSAGPAPVAVPDLVGLAADEAEAALEEAGLSGEASEAFDASVAAGTVVSQDPAPDTELAAGSAVAYVVSAGPAPVAVPDLVGLAADEAEAALEEAGLSGEASEAFDASVAAGTVVSQDPAPDTELAAGSAVAYVVSAGPAPVAVPDLVGLAADEAEAALEEAGLSGEASEAFDASVAAGTVVSQDPAPDTELAAGSAVAYVVSAGPAPVAVPDLVGLAADEAEAALEEAGLSGEASEAFDASVAAGTVVSQDPAPDTELAAGSAVAYVVSAGPAPVAVPDLVGLAADEAEAALEEAGLSGEASEAFDASVAAGTVVSQDPAPDTELAAGSAVAYVVSAGPAPVAVPDLVGLAADEAEAALEEAGLSGEASEAFDASVAAGTVVSQDPAPDTELAAGSAVAYVVSAGPAPVAVPDLVGLAADEAEAALEEAGLSGEASEAFDASVAAGTVVSQDPAPDTELAAGSAVAYVVSAGPAPVAVPDLVGLAADEATSALGSASLGVGIITEAADAAPAGEVISQDPVAGTEVPPGSAVDLAVSAGSTPVEVPEVRDLPESDAIGVLEDAGLVVADSQTRSNRNIAAGNALRTDPEAGTEVDPASEVTLFISSGPPLLPVPEVVGLSRADARDALEAAGLVEGETSRVEDASPADTVVAQEPAPDTEVAEGSPVDLVLSTGPAAVTVPDVRDLPESDAVGVLEAAGLVVADIESRANANIAAGNALRTEPEAGTELDPGSAVTLVISSGAEPVAVPALVGLSRGQARDALEAAGLVEGETSRVEDASPADTVVAQEPAPDTEVAEGSPVDLVLSTGPAAVTVPDVRDLPESDAVGVLEAAGLVVADIESRANANIAAGNALRTEPEAGTELDPGSAVTLVISSGAEPVAVPALVGLSRGQARDALEAAGLVEGETSRVEDASPADTVVAQEPAPDTEVAEGSPVDLVLSTGPAAVTVPDVRDLPESDAVGVLEAAGLVVADIESRANANIAAGNALRTEPEAGTELDPGSAVTLVISSGAEPVAVPALVGLSRGQARDALEAAGLVEGETSRVEDASPADTVVAQEPAPDTEVAEGSPVDLVLSTGPAAVTVPDVRDLPESDAVGVLEAAGLVVADIESRANANIAAGNALRTEPEAGTELDPGSAVTLVISSGAEPVAVPALVGLSRGQARDALEAAGLVEGETSRVEDASPADTVVAQEPAPDTEVAEGSPVDLVLSTGPAAVTVPDVRDLPESDAVGVLEAAGLVVADIESRANANIAAGNALRTEPEAGTELDPGSAVTLVISSGAEPVAVPALVGLEEPDAITALEDAGLVAGERTEATDASVEAGAIVSQDPAPDTEVAEGSPVDYVVSTGAPIASVGEGGSLDNATVAGQLDAVAATTPATRELPLDITPYDAASNGEQQRLLASRAALVHADDTRGEERALKRLGLLPSGANLSELLDRLYGQNAPVVYVSGEGRLSVRESVDELSASQRATAAREFGRAATDRSFGIDRMHSDPSEADAALAAVALEQGDGTAVMLEWIDSNLSGMGGSNAQDQVVPAEPDVLSSMPPILAREYELPYLDGRAFVDAVRNDGGWDAVNDAWSDPPSSTEQIIHPGRYPDDRPVEIGLDDVASRMGDGWSEQWRQTMGEARIGVWLADGAPADRKSAIAPPELPRAGAAAGWGGDQLVSLVGPGDSWAIVWQTEWDGPDDASQFTSAATDVLSGVTGAHAIAAADGVGGLSAPVLLFITSDPDTLMAAQTAFGLAS